MDLIELTRINTDYENSETGLKRCCEYYAKKIDVKPFFLYDFAKRTGRDVADILELYHQGELKEVFEAYYF